MSLKLGDTFPNLDCDTTTGKIKLHDYFGKDGWGILFSHPADYTPVCTTELGQVAKLQPEFEKLNVKVIAFSIDSVKDHEGWIKDIQAYNNNCAFGYPIIAGSRKVANQLGMLDPDEVDTKNMPVTARCVFIIGPDKKLKLSLLYPATTGRNFDEIIRVVKSLQLTAVKKVATPANWQPGQKCMIVPSLSNEAAKELFGDFDKTELPSGKDYIRMTAEPKLN